MINILNRFLELVNSGLTDANPVVDLQILAIF